MNAGQARYELIRRLTQREREMRACGRRAERQRRRDASMDKRDNADIARAMERTLGAWLAKGAEAA